jgi:hypothetical protein
MNNTKRNLTPVTIAIVAVALLLAIVGSLIGTSETFSTVDSIDFNPDGLSPDEAVVISTAEKEGFTLFWIDFRQPEFSANISFTLPEECQEQLAGRETWPITAGACDGPEGIAGPVSGTGRAADGRAIVSVTVDISEDCFATLRPGQTWPVESGACSLAG